MINGKFRVDAVLARGGMGKIYRAEQVPLGRKVALKVLRSRFADDEPDDASFQKRFFLEASILSRLQHANIVTLYDYGRIEGAEAEQYFMAMEYLAGETLSQRIRGRGALPAPEAVGIFRQIARGLREAHKNGVVHRNLKPSNIMLVPDDEGAEVVKILDFGIGKVVTDDAEELTQEGAFLGSPRYMAPEQIASEGKVDERTDIYALGVIMFECLAGKTPFEGETSVNLMMAHCSAPVPAIRQRNPAADVPEVLEALVRHALEKEPARRPAGMDALMRELRACEEAIFGGPFSVSGSGQYLGAARRSQSSIPSASWPPNNPTMSAPLPSVRTGPPSIGTHASVTRSQAPQAAKARGTPWPWLALGLVALVGGGVTAGVVATQPGKPGSPSALASQPAPTATVEPAFSLLIESTPSGAEVVEEGVVLGRSPLRLPVVRSSVQGAPRKFVVTADGYVPYTLYQGDSDADVKVSAALVPTPAPPKAVATASVAPSSIEPPRAPANRPVYVPRPPPVRTASPQPPPSPIPEIKTTR